MCYTKAPHLLLLFCLLFSCTSPHTAEHSFYYWQSTYNAADGLPADSLQKRLGVNHFYLHYFDVDWNEQTGMPVPVAAFSSTDDIHELIGSNYTPVVFITNRTFEKLADSSCEWLAQKVANKINAISSSLESAHPDAAKADKEKEIQIDCDWTAGTKDRYFHFLRAFRQLYPGYTLSATIRLYPYKYPKKTGVPPVDRGMLMCYNLGNIKEPKTVNSILDINTLRQYMTAAQYPLPLDIAFPTFGWYVWFRGNEFKGIVHAPSSLTDNSLIFSQLDNQQYRVKTDTALASNYYRSGDILRKEYPDTTTLHAAVRLVQEKVPNYKRLTFYHWHPTSISIYEQVIQNAFTDH